MKLSLEEKYSISMIEYQKVLLALNLQLVSTSFAGLSWYIFYLSIIYWQKKRFLSLKIKKKITVYYYSRRLSPKTDDSPVPLFPELCEESLKRVPGSAVVSGLMRTDILGIWRPRFCRRRACKRVGE